MSLQNTLETELHKLIESALYTEEEVRKIAAELTRSDEKLASSAKQKIDFQNCIKINKKYLLELKKRIEGSKEPKSEIGTTNLNLIFLERMAHIYKNGLSYHDDYNFNLEYLDVLQHFPKSFEPVFRDQLDKLIKKFPNVEPRVFRQGAGWYMLNKDHEETRKLLELGLKQHPKNMEIYLDLIELDSYSTDGQNKGRLKEYINGIVENQLPASFLTTLVALLVNSQEIVDYIVGKLLSNYSDVEDVWAFVATRELKGKLHPSSESNRPIDAAYCIERCVGRFQEGISKMPPEKRHLLWKKYLDSLVEIVTQMNPTRKDGPSTFAQKEVSKTVFKKGMHDAVEAKIKLDELHYMKWLEYFPRDEVLLRSLADAVKKDGKSVALWSLYLKAFALREDDVYVNTVFKDAIEALGPNSGRIWELHIEYHLLKSTPERVEDLYQQATNNEQCPDIAILFKPRYFAWTLLTKGENAARALYFRLAKKRPYSRDLHVEMFLAMQMIESSESNPEEYGDVPNKDLHSRAFDLWTEQFGAEDIDLYFNKIDSILYSGKNVKVEMKKVYDEALKNLVGEEKKQLFKQRYREYEDEEIV